MARSNLLCVRVAGALVLSGSLLTSPTSADMPKTATAAQANGDRSATSMFIDLEWRVYTLGAHLSHGPALAAGVSLLDDHLRIGFGGLARPGPFNPKTFDVALEEGTEYRGQSTISLKNDGMMGGVLLGYSTPLPFAQAFAFQMPVTLGYGGFGYYLSGDDRKTPDGRRVSEWEDELFDGKDAYIGFVIDAAARLRYRPRTLPWLMPYAGVGFTMVPGFTTIVRDDYFGVSGLVGVELGTGR